MLVKVTVSIEVVEVVEVDVAVAVASDVKTSVAVKVAVEVSVTVLNTVAVLERKLLQKAAAWTAIFSLQAGDCG
jgi:hypothetical protein